MDAQCLIRPPYLDEPSRLIRREQVLVQALVAEATIEAINEVALLRLARADEMPLDALVVALGSGLIGQSQKMTVAASAMAEKKAVGHRS